MSLFSILHTEWSDGWGGQERRVLAEIEGMQSRGHTLFLATRKEALIAEKAAQAGIQVIHLPFAGKFDLRTLFALKKFIHDQKINLVNTHSGIDSWVGGMAARLAGVRLVRTRHLHLPLKRNFANFVHYLPHAVVTCGQTMRDTLVADGFPKDNVVSIPTGVDFSNFVPKTQAASVRESLGGNSDTFVVLMVGVIRGVKRHEIALRAFARFFQTVPNSLLVLAGEGPMQIDMERLSNELHIKDRVRFLGHRDDIPDLLAAANLLILTSRSEGVPQAVTQALGAGLPVIATDVGSVPELILHNKTGLLIPPESVSAATEALFTLYQNPVLAKTLAEAGKRHVLAHYSLEAMLDATEALYHKLLQ